MSSDVRLRCRSGFATPTETFEDAKGFQNVSDGVANPVTLQWSTVRLQEITSMFGDGLHGTPDYDGNGDYYFINGNNLINGRIEFNEKTKRASNTEYQKIKKELNDRTIFVSINGTLGNVALYHGEKVILGKSACYFNVLDGVDRQFVRYVLTSEKFQNYIDTFATGSTIKNVSLKLMRNFSFELPVLDEQKKISQILKALDDRIALLRETNATLEAIAQALFKSWFVDFDPVHANADLLPSPSGRGAGGEGEGDYSSSPHSSPLPEGEGVVLPPEIAALFPDSFEASKLGLVPSGWHVLSFADTVKVIGGGTPKTSIPEYWDGDIPWFSVVDAPTITDVFVIDTTKHISVQGLNKSSTKLLPEGTTIISARGTVGRLALVGREMAMNQSCYGLRGKADDAYFTYFSTYRLVEALKQRSHGSVFDTITTETMKGVSVIYPDVKVIHAFETVLSPVMIRIKTNLEQAQTLTTLRDTLLPRLISGQLRLPDAEALTQPHS